MIEAVPIESAKSRYLVCWHQEGPSRFRLVEGGVSNLQCVWRSIATENRDETDKAFRLVRIFRGRDQNAHIDFARRQSYKSQLPKQFVARSKEHVREFEVAS